MIYKIAGITIYSTVKSQYKQVASGWWMVVVKTPKPVSVQSKPAVHLVLPPIKIPREMVFCERENNQVGAVTSP